MAEIDLTKMSYAQLVKALIKDNSLAEEFDHLNLWEEFDSDYWCELLSAQPQFVDKCAEYKVWEKFDSFNWSNLLKSQPQFADKYTEYKGWEEFDSFNWSELLSSQLQFTEKAKEYSSGWAGLLQIKPKLANECECWEKFDSYDWSHLLSAHPQFANKCNWSKMRANNYDKYDEDEYEDFEDWKAECGEDYSEDWKNLLLKQPQLAEYFTDVLWDGFSEEDWEVLEAKHPGVFEDKHMLSTLRKIAED